MTVVSRQFKQAKNESASNHSLRNTVLNVGKSMKGSARGNWDPWEGQQPFPPNPKRGRGPHNQVETTANWYIY